jgi:hypothetical protein
MSTRLRKIRLVGWLMGAVGKCQKTSAKTTYRGGGSGIRTRDTVSRIHTFQACAFNHSATPPQGGSSYSLRAPARNWSYIDCRRGIRARQVRPRSQRTARRGTERETFARGRGNPSIALVAAHHMLERAARLEPLDLPRDQDADRIVIADRGVVRRHIDLGMRPER